MSQPDTVAVSRSALFTIRPEQVWQDFQQCEEYRDWLAGNWMTRLGLKRRNPGLRQQDFFWVINLDEVTNGVGDITYGAGPDGKEAPEILNEDSYRDLPDDDGSVKAAAREMFMMMSDATYSRIQDMAEDYNLDPATMMLILTIALRFYRWWRRKERRRVRRLRWRSQPAS